MLAQRLGVAQLVEQRVRLDGKHAGAANPGAKALTVLGAMLAGALVAKVTDVDWVAGAGPKPWGTEGSWHPPLPVGKRGAEKPAR